MLKYYSKVGARIFLAPPNEPSGGPGNPGAGQGGHGPQVSVASPVDPFAGLDLDDLPPEVKEKLVKAKEQFATLQTSSQQAQQQIEAANRQAREFQSRHDRLQADLQRLQGGQQQQPQVNPQEVLISQIEAILVKKGIPAEQAKLQAPIHAELLGVQSETVKREMGAALQPVVGAVLQQQASGAWNAVMQNDRLGALQIPEVAEATWQGVQHLVQQGQQITPEVIANLKNMHYAAHLETTGGVPQFVPGPPTLNQPMPLQPQPQYPNMATRFTYPNAGGHPSMPPAVDPNAPKHQLNADTQAALAQTFSRMGTIQPKAFKKP